MRTGRCASGLVLASALVCGAVVAISRDGGAGTAATPRRVPSTVVSGPVQFDRDGPVRIYDTREDDPTRQSIDLALGVVVPSPPGGLTAGHDALVGTVGFVPDDAAAVLVNITIVAPDPSARGYVAAYSDVDRGTSTINWTRPGVYSNAALVPLTDTATPTRHFALHWEGVGRPHVIVDLMGWITGSDGGAAAPIGTTSAVAPADTTLTSGIVQLDRTFGAERGYDSRWSFERLTLPRSFPLAPIPAVPDGATALLVNITVVASDPGSFGLAAAIGADGDRGTSTLNWGEPGVYSRFALAPISRGSPEWPHITLELQGNHPIELVVDVAGWIVDPAR